MSKLLSPLLVLFCATACGGTATGDATSNGTSGGTGNGVGQGGSSGSAHAGTGSSGLGAAGNPSQGGGSAGGSANVAGVGGDLVITFGGAGGAPPLADPDPRCPAREPMGACSAPLEGAFCQYQYFTDCLCHPMPAGTYTVCTQVDPTCSLPVAGAPGVAGAGGAAGAGGSAGAASGGGGIGGVSAKIALPPQKACTCTAGSWVCSNF